MAGETMITIVGNLVDEPELRYTPSGAALVKFRIASTPRTFDKASNEWKDGEALFLTCVAWQQIAENIAETFGKGMRVIVQGALLQRSYETREGEKRSAYEIRIEEAGPSTRYATAKVHKVARSKGAYGGNNTAAASASGPADDFWSTSPAAATTAHHTEEPPF